MVDVLIIAALPDEADAARDVALASGVSEWVEMDANTAAPYLLGNYVASGFSMSVALWDSTRMGGLAIASIIGVLVERVKPRCLAMCGVCAGNPSDVALGDVIISEMVYQYDEGKRTSEGFIGDHRQFLMSDDWVRAAQNLTPDGLPSFGEPSESESKIWVLERLYAGDDVRNHPARLRYFQSNSWEPRIRGLEGEGLVRRNGKTLTLTDKGRSQVEEQQFYRDAPPQRLPFQIKVGPIASGNVVVKDGVTWGDLKKWGVRSVVALEMEAATIGSAAYHLKVPSWVVVKGAMDHADYRKDDRYKPFAARASAEVLFKFLAGRLALSTTGSGRARSTLVKTAYLIGGETGETDFPQFEASELGFRCTTLGGIIARAGADLIVCSPFPDSADHHAVRGYVQTGVGGRIHFHSPRGKSVEGMRLQLEKMLGEHQTKFLDYFYPAPENPDDKEQRQQAWLLCQLQALEYADVVIAIGGRLSNTANTLLHIAEARRIPVVPFAFLGGASARSFKRRDWEQICPGFDYHPLLQKEGIDKAMEIADFLVADRLRGPHVGHNPPTAFFISRAQTDGDFSAQLVAFLKTKGLRCFLGDEEIRDDRMIQSSIEDAVLKSDVCIILWSKAYALSRWCFDELELALSRESAGEMKVWLFNLDASEIVPRAARRLPQAVVRTPNALVNAVNDLLG